MSETLLGIIIGGAIGVVPTIVMVFVEVWKQRQQQKHELKMRKLEMIDQPRLEAIQEYARQCGAFFSSQIHQNFSKDSWLASHEHAAVYVSAETLEAMNAAAPVIMAGWDHRFKGISLEEKLNAPEIMRLNECLRREMQLSYAEAVKPARRRDKKHRK